MGRGLCRSEVRQRLHAEVSGRSRLWGVHTSQNARRSSYVLASSSQPAAAESAGATLRDVSLTHFSHRNGLSRGRSRRVHGRSGPHRHRDRHRRRQGRVPVPGVPPIYEPGLDELLASVLPTGRLRFTTDYAEAAARTSTSSAWALRSARASTPPTRHTSSRRASHWRRT